MTRYEVVSSKTGAVRGYVKARDLDRAYDQAERRYGRDVIVFKGKATPAERREVVA